MPGSAFAIMSAASRDRCRHSLSSLPLCTARALTDNPTAKVTTTRSTTAVAVWTRQAKRDATIERATVAELGVVASDADRSGALRHRSLPWNHATLPHPHQRIGLPQWPRG